jgi:hypothetical protein
VVDVFPGPKPLILLLLPYSLFILPSAISKLTDFLDGIPVKFLRNFTEKKMKNVTSPVSKNAVNLKNPG